MFVTLEERGKAGTVIHDKSATLCTLRGDDAVSQEELENGNRAAGVSAPCLASSVLVP